MESAAETVRRIFRMAIDGYGREIFLSDPYTLTVEDDIDAVGITAADTYGLWIRYRTDPSRPPVASVRPDGDTATE